MSSPPSRPLHAVLLFAVWLACATLVAAGVFLTSSRVIDVASHETTVRPNLSGDVLVETGPILPDLTMPSGSFVGVDLTLGNTDATNVETLVDRYAFIASNPTGQIARVRQVVRDMAELSALKGAVAGLLPLLMWWLLGPNGRAVARRRLRTPSGLWAALLSVAVVCALTQPWGYERGEEARSYAAKDASQWQSLQEYVGRDVLIPDSVPDGLRIRGDLTTDQGRRLLESAIETYDSSKRWYADVAAAARDLELRVPAEDETVAVLVSDRHDNIGMDLVTRSIAEAAQATAILNAGDDTSTGSRWEAFSLDSISDTFEDFDRWAVSGNHDNGSFVHDYLVNRGWTNPDGTVVDGPGGSVLSGVDDYRSSGLGRWRDDGGKSFTEHEAEIAEVVCDSETRVNTLLVHDANAGRTALRRGCVDLVVGGHVHVQSGPTPVEGENGAVGYSYTNGTTGGAAYAIAMGSKPKRPAGVTLITYRGGRPVGIQYVLVQTNGRIDIDEYVDLSYPKTPDTIPGTSRSAAKS